MGISRARALVTLTWALGAAAVGTATAGCEERAHGDVRLEPKRVEIDATQAHRDLERGVATVGRKLSSGLQRAAESETVQRAGDEAQEAAKDLGREAREGAEEAGDALERGARKAAKKTGEALENAGEELQQKSGDAPPPRQP